MDHLTKNIDGVQVFTVGWGSWPSLIGFSFLLGILALFIFARLNPQKDGKGVNLVLEFCVILSVCGIAMGVLTGTLTHSDINQARAVADIEAYYGVELENSTYRPVPYSSGHRSTKAIYDVVASDQTTYDSLLVIRNDDEVSLWVPQENGYNEYVPLPPVTPVEG